MKSPVVRVLYFDDAGKAHPARTLEAPNFDGLPTRLLVGGIGGRLRLASGASLAVLDARYSRERKPGTWSRLVERAS